MTFISKVKQGAINGWYTHQILPSISIAQAILESASGTSSLGAKYNNLFGIKASADWSGKVINLPTREHGPNGSYQTNANFRWYDSWNDSMVDHAAFFTNTPWRVENYKHVVGETDYKAAARALQSAGYATDPQYATKLIQRIEQNNLTQYDTEAFNGEPSNVGVIKKVVGGTLTELAKSAVKQYNITLIGDSLGVGTQPKLTGAFKSFTHDVLGSRQITHTTNSLNGTYVLQSLKDYGQLKDIVVVVLGTNRGVTDTEIDNFVAIAGNRKVIFVDTNSNVTHRQSVSDAYRRASERHNNVYHANWMAYSNRLRSRYYGSDDIHMTNEGYQSHADFIKMAVYEASVGVKTTSGTIGSTTEYIGIEELDYKEGDLVSPKGESIIYNHPANELWGSKTGERVIWIESILEVDSDDPQFILETAVKVMKENGQPAAQYVVDLAELPDDVSIGDWGYVLDHEFNPPLYIHARVLEIITSETDLNANKAVIGNVTEVFPADKSDIKLIQADLKDARDNLVRDYRKGQPILMLVNSTNGSTLGDKYTETELVAKVTQGAEDLTNRFITYKWERASNDTASDDAYNAIIETETTNRLIITSKDIVNNLSTFVVRVYDGDNLINQSSITIKHVDTALWTDTNTPPSDAKDGSTWVDETGKHWILKDGEWEERVDQAVISQVRVEVEGAMAEAEQAKQDVITATNQALANAKEHAIAQDKLIKDQIASEVGIIGEEMEQAKQDATDKANQALTDAKSYADTEIVQIGELFDGLIKDVESDVAEAKQTADGAVDEINAAITNAGFTSLDAAIQNLTIVSSDAERSALQAIGSANSAYGLAQTSISEAQTAQANSLTALGKANNALEGVSDLDFRVDDVEAELELKANNTFLNEDGTLTTLSNAITFNANRFSSDMSRIESRVESLAGEINLVILRDAIEGRRIEANTVYPNVSFVDAGHNTMRELITVTGGEKIALSKEATTPITNDINWRVIFYDSQMGIISRPMTASNEIVLTVPNNATKMWVSWPKGSKPQIIRGSEFLPYRPNMADQMTTDEMVIFRNEYDEYADRTERRLSAIDSTGGSLDVLSNEIITTAEQVKTDMTALIDAKVGNEEFTEFYQNEYSETAQEVSRKVSLSDINIGTRNIILNSDKPIDLLDKGILKYNVITHAWPSVLLPDGTAGGVIEFGTEVNNGWLRFRPFKFETGKEYTFSFWARRSTAGASLKLGVGINSEGNSSIQSKEVDVSTTWQRFVFTAKISRDVNLYNFVELRPPRFTWNDDARYYIWRPQLERANVASDWKEAPEDTNTQINHIQTEWTQTFNSFEFTVSDNFGAVNQNIQRIDSSLSTINDPVTGRLTIAEQTLNGFNNEVYNSDGTSKITQLATGVQSLVTDLSELEIGGRNLIKNSDYKNGLPEREMYNASVSVLERFDPYGGISPVMRLVPSADNHYFRFQKVIPRNDATYTFSAWMRRTNGTDYGVSIRIGTERDGETVIVGDTWKKVKVTGKAIRGTDVYHFVEIDTNNQWVTIDIFEPMFEFGTVASTHQVAPEDTQSQISQLANNINLRVAKGDIVNQINVSTEGILIEGKRTHITGMTTIDEGVITNAHIANLNASKINAGTIDTARLNASDIVTKGLTANVIKSTHIMADALLVDKVFSNQASVDKLWSKTIWTTKLTAMAIDAGQINAGTIATARLNASDIVTKGLTANVVTSTHIKSDDALIDKLFATSALIERLTSKTAFISQLKAIDLVADKASFVTAGFKALNSQSTINGNAIRIQNTAGEFVEMNNTPELRSDDAGGTAVVLGKGRVHFYDSRGHSKGYVGTDMHTTGSYDFGTFLSKGSGIYRFARMADATETTYAYYTVKAGITTASPIITDMVRTGLLPDGNAQQFVAKGNMISQLNGWPSYPNWPALSAGQQIRYKELTAQTTGDAYEDIWKFGPSSTGDWRIYFAKHATFEGGTTGTSDRRIKHDIAPTQIKALDHIDSLTFKEFKWNRNNSFEPLGLIAQDSGILRVPGGEDEMEGIDIQRALMLALKGIQELQEEIKQLKGA